MALTGSDIYITFSYRDSCPNVVVEAMAHGLPVVGIGSGGVPDIVSTAGVLLPAKDFENGFFTAQRYEHDFPHIDFEKVLDAVLIVMSNYGRYQLHVQERFKEQLGINVVAENYAKVLRQIINC
jgi:glycosyltransferase involved in cell wall biosynthesis